MPPLSENPETRLAVGAVAILHIERYGKDSPRHRTFIRGWEEGKCVILDAPRLDGTPVRLQPHDRCIIRFFCRGDACGFDASVRDSSTKTFPFLYVGWPDRVDITQIRQHQRVELKLPCVVLTHTGERLNGEIRDLSVGGCRFASRLPLEDDAPLRLSFSLPDGSRIEDLPATVRVCRPQKEEFACGCEFDSATDGGGGLRDIEFFVTTRISQGRTDGSSQRPVLVLEPDSGRMEHLCGEFEELGFPVFGAPSVVDAAYRLRVSTPGVLLVSANQTGCTPADVCRWVRNAPGMGELPVLVYDTDAASVKQVKESGASEVFPISNSTGPLIRAAIRFLNS
jgi:c-di-GMP-binding flagellar brake protein YcgR/CheY-like chemotaxis protein